jgi:ABC-type uncharacterized transport system permease subunit
MNTATIIALVIRHGLTTLGGYLVSQGTLAQPDVETGVGALVALAGIVWSVFEKRAKAK